MDEDDDDDQWWWWWSMMVINDDDQWWWMIMGYHLWWWWWSRRSLPDAGQMVGVNRKDAYRFEPQFPNWNCCFMSNPHGRDTQIILLVMYHSISLSHESLYPIVPTGNIPTSFAVNPLFSGSRWYSETRNPSLIRKLGVVFRNQKVIFGNWELYSETIMYSETETVKLGNFRDTTTER